MNVRRAVVAALAALGLAPGAPAAAPHGVSPAEIERDLAAGRPVVEEDATIQGDVDLIKYAGRMKRYPGNIESLFVCNRCTFAGSLIAPHVVFERGIDLSGSRIKGSLNLRGALFREPALFGGAGKPTDFGGNADFTFAVFDDLAVFRGARFAADARFTSAQFRSVARFSRAEFDRSSSFGDGIFAADALFAGAIFNGNARFDDAVFGRVSDFRKASFLAGATFSEASFLGRAEFSRALINHEVSFDDARFGSDALFLGTNFGEDTPAVLFENTAARGRIDLQESVLGGSATFNQVTARSLSFDGMTYRRSSSKLNMTGVVATDVSLGVAGVQHLFAPADELAILHSAEETAKSAGNLGLANDLHYRIQDIASRNDGWLRRIADHAFYRGVAGYLVRPFRPLLWLFGLVLFAASLRALRLKSRTPGRLRRAWLEFVHALEATIMRRERVADEPPPLRRVELTVYAVLFGGFLLALANTNPTLRDMVNAIV
jgi:hypothetical protein